MSVCRDPQLNFVVAAENVGFEPLRHARPRRAAGLVPLRLPDRERRKPVRVNKVAVVAGAGPAGLTAAPRIAAPLADRAHRLRGGRSGGWDLQDRQLPRQSDGSRRPSILFEIRLGDALVAGNPADRAGPNRGRCGAAHQLPGPVARIRALRRAARRNGLGDADPTGACRESSIGAAYSIIP